MGRPVGVEEERAPRVQTGHHNAAEPMLLGPMNVAHRLLHVVKVHEGLTRQPSWCSRAEVGQPTVIGHVASVGEHGVGCMPGVLELIGLEWNTVGEQHFCDHTLGFKILEAHGRVPLPFDGQLGLAISGVWSARRFHSAYPIVVGLDVVAVDRSRSPNVPIDRNDCRASHWNPSRRLTSFSVVSCSLAISLLESKKHALDSPVAVPSGHTGASSLISRST